MSDYYHRFALNKIWLIFLSFVLTKEVLSIDPSSLKIKVFGAWLSKSEYCTKPLQIFGSIEPIELNFLGEPALGSLDNTDASNNGTYKCFIIQLTETLKFVPSTTNGYCTAGTEYTTRICPAGQSTIHPDTGEMGTCQDGSLNDDTIFLYMSTASSPTTLNTSTAPFLPPTASALNNGLHLGQALVVNGSQSAKFVVDVFDKIESYGLSCRINTPLFSFNPIVSN